MNYLASLADKFSRDRVAEETAEHLESLAQEPIRASRRRARELLRTLRAAPGPHVELGETTWGEPVLVPLAQFVKTCGIATGGTGSGKTMAACLVLESLISHLPRLRSMAFAVVDAKGELFDRALYLLALRLNELQGQAREELLDRIVVMDFSSPEAVSPYNILSRWPYTERDFFVTSRLETLRELLPAGKKVSLRGTNVLKNILSLLSEFGLPLTYLDDVLSSEALREKTSSAHEEPCRPSLL